MFVRGIAWHGTRSSTTRLHRQTLHFILLFILDICFSFALYENEK